MKLTKFLLIVLLAFGASISAQNIQSYKKNTKEAITELKSSITDSDKLQKAIKIAEDMELNGIYLISTNQYKEAITSIGNPPSGENQQAYSTWKKQSEEFKETHVSVSDLISRL